MDAPRRRRARPDSWSPSDPECVLDAWLASYPFLSDPLEFRNRRFAPAGSLRVHGLHSAPSDRQHDVLAMQTTGLACRLAHCLASCVVRWDRDAEASLGPGSQRPKGGGIARILTSRLDAVRAKGGIGRPDRTRSGSLIGSCLPLCREGIGQNPARPRPTSARTNGCQAFIHEVFHKGFFVSFPFNTVEVVVLVGPSAGSRRPHAVGHFRSSRRPLKPVR